MFFASKRDPTSSHKLLPSFLLPPLTWPRLPQTRSSPRFAAHEPAHWGRFFPTPLRQIGHNHRPWFARRVCQVGAWAPPSGLVQGLVRIFRPAWPGPVVPVHTGATAGSRLADISYVSPAADSSPGALRALAALTQEGQEINVTAAHLAEITACHRLSKASRWFPRVGKTGPIGHELSALAWSVDLQTNPSRTQPISVTPPATGPDCLIA